MAVSAILQGSAPKESEVPPIASEFFLALEFGWTLDYIRRLPYKDVDTLTTLIGVMYRIKSQGKDVTSQSIASAMLGAK